MNIKARYLRMVLRVTLAAANEVQSHQMFDHGDSGHGPYDRAMGRIADAMTQEDISMADLATFKALLEDIDDAGIVNSEGDKP